MDLQRHLKQGIWALFDKSLTGIYGLVFVVVVMAHLPKSEFGIFSIIFTVASITLLFNKGFILFPMTKYEAEGESQPKLLGSAFALSFICLLAFGSIIFISAPLIASFLHEPELLKLLRLVPALIMGFFIRDFSLSYFQAHQRVKSLAIIDAVYFLGLAAAFIIMKLTGKLTSALNVLYAHMFFSYISSAVAAFFVSGDIKIKIGIDKEQIKKLAGFGKFSLSMGIGEIIFYQMDILILQRFFEPVTVAVYQSAKVLFRMFSLISQSLNLLIFPGASKLYFQNRIEDIKQLYEKILAMYWILLAGVSIILFFSAPLLLKLLNYPESVNIFRIFLLLSFFEPLYSISMNVLFGMGEAVKAFKPLAAAVIIFFLTSIILIPYFKGYGAAASFGTTIIYLGCAYLFILHREVGISIKGIFGYMLSAPSVVKKIIAERSASLF